MKGKIIVSAFWTAFFSAGKAQAITLFPFIFLGSKSLQRNARLLQHERIHLQQCLELLVVPFYIWYVLEFVWRYLQHRNFQLAYLNISFEREAYRHEADPEYLQRRQRWAFRHDIRR